jgi:hypothetical protein
MGDTASFIYGKDCLEASMSYQKTLLVIAFFPHKLIARGVAILLRDAVYNPLHSSLATNLLHEKRSGLPDS